MDYGARPDGSGDSTDALRSAIQAAKAAGGGTVCVPPGNYVTGPIDMVDNLVLCIEAGATLHFPATRLPYTKGRVQGIECLTPVPLIGGHNLTNVTITGHGVITTDNLAWLRLVGRPPGPGGGTGGGGDDARASSADLEEARRFPPSRPYPLFGPAWNHLLDLLKVKTPQPEEEYLKVAPRLRPAFVRFMDSKNILIEDIHIVGSPFWTIHILYSESAVVRNVDLETYPGSFTGGIYIDSSRDVRITGCSLDSGDDAITLKAGKDADGLRVNRPTENVTITNCIFHRGSSAIALGSETSGGIRNVLVSDLICRGTQMGIHIKSQRGRGGVVENIRMENLVMENVGKAITVSEYYTKRSEAAPPEPVTERTPVLRDISISHVTIKDCWGDTDNTWNPVIPGGDKVFQVPGTIIIEGLPEMPISGLRLSDIVASGKAGLIASDTVGLELHNVQMDAKGGPAFLVRDSRDLELDGVSTRQPLPNEPVVRLERCPGTVLRASRAVAGTGTFLSVPRGELGTVVLEGNVLGAARQPIFETDAPAGGSPQP
jgi:polygalacturonase